MKELKVGEEAPSFNLRDQKGQTVRTDDFRGKKLLVYFYPKADTPGCTKQSCAVQNATPELQEAGVVALGISPDSPDKQNRFAEKYQLGFPLLADEDHHVAEAYGVWTEKSMYGKKYMGINRSSFLIDEEGIIAATWYGVSPNDTVPNLLKALS